MKLNADFSLRAAVHARETEWLASPMPGVWRKMLDRVGDEVARATSLVRYDPGSRFPRHEHGGGEEIFVLEGVFQDEHGDYPPQSYLRNPPGSSHAPAAEAGCIIFVKLWQFDAADRLQVRLATGEVAPVDVASRAHVRVQSLHQDAREDVRIETWAAGQAITLAPAGRRELLVLEGTFTEGGEAFSPWSWLRLPQGAPLEATAGPSGARVWVKELTTPQAETFP